MLALAAAAGALVVCPAAGSRDRAAGWTRTDLTPITQPAPVGGALLLEVAQGGNVRIDALDARTGKTLWSSAASTGYAPPGEPPSLVVVGDRVVYLRKVSQASAEIVAADARSGRPIWHSGPGVFNDSPHLCAGESSTICIGGSLLSQREERLELRFDAATGRRLPTPPVNGSGRSLAPNLFDPGRRNPEIVIATKGASVAWSRLLRELFPLRGASTDWGWNFDRNERVDLYVGSPGWGPIRTSPKELMFDLARAQTAGFETETGGVVWRSHGTYVCGFLPCPGASHAGYDSRRSGAGPTVGLRLVSEGTVTAATSGVGLPAVSGDARTAIEGFEPGSGATLWRFDAGHARSLISHVLLPAQTAANVVVLYDSRRRLVELDLAHGKQTTVSASASGWCRKVVQYRQAFGYDTRNGRTLHDYVGQPALFPCVAASHERLPVPDRVPRFVGSIGARSAGLVAWSDATGVIARPAR